MKDIVAVTRFKHGKVQFVKDAAYSLPDVFAGYFVGVGWARPWVQGDPPATPVPVDALSADAPPAARSGETLEVQNATLGMTASIK